VNNPSGEVTNEFASMIQNIKVNVGLSREELCELSKKSPYHRFISFPIEIDEDLICPPADEEVK